MPLPSGLVNLLYCPYCGATLTESGYLKDAGDVKDVVDKTWLSCAGCDIKFPVKEGISAFYDENTSDEVKLTQKKFSEMWRYRFADPHYHTLSNVYGFLPLEFSGWMADIFRETMGRPPSRIIEIGCGSGEKIALLARLFPEATVIGLDMADSLALTKREFNELPNLHFVQADLHCMPFAPQSFDFVISIGVLHHTPDTNHAFEKVSNLLSETGMYLTWIYPAPGEDEFWDALYLQRDFHFGGEASRLPAETAWWMSHIYGGFLLLPIMDLVKRYNERNSDRYPFSTRRMSIREFYDTVVFTTFDNIHPVYQHRHAKREVESWYRQKGLMVKKLDMPGFYCGFSNKR
jgi:ubiquinone/menaquinone biosynthesis C-methylase UbiE